MSEIAVRDGIVRGWCPSAWRPMMAGDGLLIRVRPRLGRLTRVQVAGLCEAATRHGNGMIDVTSRANLQIRGVGEGALPDLLDRLVALDLVDADRMAEERRAIMVAPDWIAGDNSPHIAAQLIDRLADLPDLPAKTGFAIDVGSAPILSSDPADFRIERGEDGGLILRADGRVSGMPVERDTAVDALIALARWFVESGGREAGRMARHPAPLPEWAEGCARPATVRPPIAPGAHALGHAYGVMFGSMTAADLAALMAATGAEALRVTPWRVLLLEGGRQADAAGFSSDAASAAIRIHACPGAPLCPQATVETRPLALRLAPHVAGRLHVSGCAKGCAHAGPADVTLTGRDGLFDLVPGGRAGDPPSRTGLHPHDLFARFGAD